MIHKVTVNYNSVSLDVEIETHGKSFQFVRIMPAEYNCNCACKELFEAEQNRLISILNSLDVVINEITDIIKADFGDNEWADCDRLQD